MELGLHLHLSPNFAFCITTYGEARVPLTLRCIWATCFLSFCFSLFWIRFFNLFFIFQFFFVFFLCFCYLFYKTLCHFVGLLVGSSDIAIGIAHSSKSTSAKTRGEAALEKIRRRNSSAVWLSPDLIWTVMHHKDFELFWRPGKTPIPNFCKGYMHKKFFFKTNLCLWVFATLLDASVRKNYMHKYKDWSLFLL